MNIFLIILILLTGKYLKCRNIYNILNIRNELKPYQIIYLKSQKCSYCFIYHGSSQYCPIYWAYFQRTYSPIFAW